MLSILLFGRRVLAEFLVQSGDEKKYDHSSLSLDGRTETERRSNKTNRLREHVKNNS